MVGQKVKNLKFSCVLEIRAHVLEITSTHPRIWGSRTSSTHSRNSRMRPDMVGQKVQNSNFHVCSKFEHMSSKLRAHVLEYEHTSSKFDRTILRPLSAHILRIMIGIQQHQSGWTSVILLLFRYSHNYWFSMEGEPSLAQLWTGSLCLCTWPSTQHRETATGNVLQEQEEWRRWCPISVHERRPQLGNHTL
jgi:hypothetical protein